MAINFICGKPGGGKSLLAAKKIIEELGTTNRMIVTNLPLNFINLHSYLREKGKEADLEKRIQVLDETECKKFWEHRGPGRPQMKITDRGIKMEVKEGVLYVIDEFHLFYNSREWQTVGKEAIYYASQHRHLGDDVIAVTQFVGNVDKQFRVLAESFTLMRNLSKERWMGIAMPRLFFWRSYLDCPSPSATVIESGTFRLDVSGIASCYYTAKGVGLEAVGAADTQVKRKGIPFAFVIVLFVGIIVAGCFVPGLLGKGVNMALGVPEAVSKKHKYETPTNGVQMISGPATSTAIAYQPPEAATGHQVEPKPEQKPQVYITGIIQDRNGLQAWVSDGRIVDFRTIRRYGRSGVLLSTGELIPMAPPSTNGPAVPACCDAFTSQPHAYKVR